METHIPTGRYRHYKGGEYQVYGTAHHSETEELLVVYRPLYGAGDLWVRPLQMFCETIDVSGNKMLRFELIKEDSESQL